MKLQNLRLFCTACQYPSVRKAAEALGLSVSAITYAIGELESEFQVTLFTKKGRNLALTQEGASFYALCSALLTKADATERELHRVAKKHDVLKIGISPILGHCLFGRIETEMKRKFPDVQLLRHELSSDIIQDRLLLGTLDCAIVPASASLHPSLEQLCIGETEYVCCVGPTHRLSDSLFVSCGQLQDEPMAMPDRSFDCSRFVHRLFERKGLRLDLALETSQMDTIRTMVGTGHAITFVNKEYARLYPKQLVAIPVDDEDMRQTLCLVWSREHCRSAAFSKFSACLSDTAPL